MTATLTRQPTLVSTAPPSIKRSGPIKRSGLSVGRRDIRFQNVAPDRVRVDVTVQNSGSAPSLPTQLRLQVAPLGAFLPWQDLATLELPAIRGNGITEVSSEFLLSGRPPLGDFSRVPPRKLLTALGNGDRPPEPDSNGGNLFRRVLRNLLNPATNASQSPGLPADPFALLDRGVTHWAGNINVLINDQAVERHTAQALRIYPGRTNLAIFVVGSRPDQYKFELSGSGASWESALYEMSAASSLLNFASEGDRIAETQWVPMNGRQLLMLGICPPMDSQQGNVNVHIRQRSSDKEAIVEFSLDANAAGAGCYTV